MERDIMSQIIMDKIILPKTKQMRTLRIYMPDIYKDERLPVLYMHDAQNLFDDKASYANVSWGVKETLDYLIFNHIIPPIMVVGIDNSKTRTSEYAPYPSSDFVKNKLSFDIGGGGDDYAKFCVLHLKPFIDQKYPTKPDFEHTLMAGSSLGGLITSYIAAKFPDVYRHLGIFSLASWFNEEAFLNDVKTADLNLNQTYFITIGNFESSDESLVEFPDIYVSNSRNYKDMLRAKGITDIYYQETDDKHDEMNWRKAFPQFIKFSMKNR
jgi:uncharacterized protein